MQAFICVYRQRIPTDSQLRKTQEAAKSDEHLAEFLRIYDDSVFDWGDDPSFYSAQVRFGDVRKASWGVCRPNVRKLLKPEDLVVFFCGRASRDESKMWDYFYVGFGTVE